MSSDTYFRERLDEVDPGQLRVVYKCLFSHLQRGKELERFSFPDGHYLLSLDGTGHFSSTTVHCEHCGEKHHRNGTITYHHQMLGAVLVHPDIKEVIPLALEPILKQDGATKNDCERNADKRPLKDLRREHPFGHGYKHLSSVLMHLMMLAFLIDQIQQGCCRLFQAALTAARRKIHFWRKFRSRFDMCLIPSWEALYRSFIHPPPPIKLGYGTS